jgi:TRAP-type C4-dicarboxylate transport system permease small subunit
LALLGGALTLAVAGLVTVSVLKRWATSRGIEGDFDIVQLALPVAVFAFLPVCHLHRANILVDSFTTRLPQRMQRAIDAFWSLAYAAIAGLIVWGMLVGASETIANGTTTMVLGLPIGWAMVLAGAFAAWLAVVAVAGAIMLIRRPT